MCAAYFIPLGAVGPLADLAPRHSKPLAGPPLQNFLEFYEYFSDTHFRLFVLTYFNIGTLAFPLVSLLNLVCIYTCICKRLLHCRYFFLKCFEMFIF